VKTPKHRAGWIGKWRGAALAASLLGGGAAHAGPYLQCAKDLYACGKNAAMTVVKSAEAAAEVLQFIAEHPDCVAAMTSGSPTAVGVTGLVIGLNAAGMVHPGSCEADIYGTAAQPLTEGLQSLGLNTGGMAGAALGQIPVPGVPPSVGGLVGCGCGALSAGAQAIDDIKAVAQFAATTYSSCKAAANSCPGLSQAIQGIGWLGHQVATAVTDPACIVQDSDSMSRAQYHAARIRPLFPQFVNMMVADNLAWSGSYSEAELTAALDVCTGYYDRHCMKEGEAKSFCYTHVWAETSDPELWRDIATALNAQVFPKVFSEMQGQYLRADACPAGGGISLDPNAASGEKGTNALLSENRAQCQGEMLKLVTGNDNSLKSMVLDMLPTTGEGWSDVRGKPAEKPVDNAKKVYRRLITAAGVVMKQRIQERLDHYLQRDKEIRAQGAQSAMPENLLNQSYQGWAVGTIMATMGKCPADAKGWAGKFDMGCVKAVAGFMGFDAVPGHQTAGSSEFPAQYVQPDVKAGMFKGAAPYGKASEVYYATAKALNAQEETAYNEAWKQARAAAKAVVDGAMPALLYKYASQQADAKAQRDGQVQTLEDLGKLIESTALRANGQCMARPDPAACGASVKNIADQARGVYQAQRKALDGQADAQRPWAERLFRPAVQAITKAQDQATAAYQTLLGGPRGQRPPPQPPGARPTPAPGSAPSTAPLPGHPGAPAIGGAPPRAFGLPSVPGLQPRPRAPEGGLPPAVVAARAPVAPNAPPNALPNTLPNALPGRAPTALEPAATPPAEARTRLPSGLAPTAPAVPADALAPGRMHTPAPPAEAAPTPPGRANTPVAVPSTPPIAPPRSMPPAIAVPAPPAPAPAVVAAAPPMATGAVPVANTPPAARVLAPAPPLAPPAFDEAAYRRARQQALASTWLPRCPDARCRAQVETLLARQLGEEVAAIQRDPAALSQPAQQAQLQQRMDARYAPLLAAELRPAATPPALAAPSIRPAAAPSATPPAAPPATVLPRGLPPQIKP